MKCMTETVRGISNDEDKSLYEVGPDQEGFGLVEIRYRGEDGKVGERMTFPAEIAKQVSKAMAACADDLERKDS